MSGDLVLQFRSFLNDGDELKDYFSLYQKAMEVLTKESGLQSSELYERILRRCKETLSGVHSFMNLLQYCPSDDDFTRTGEELLRHEAELLCRSSYDYHLLLKDKGHLNDLMEKSKSLLNAWLSWNHTCKLRNIQQDEVIFNETLAAGIVAQVITGVCKRKVKKLWWILGLCEQFFGLLIKKNIDGLGDLVKDILSDRDPIVLLIN